MFSAIGTAENIKSEINPLAPKETQQFASLMGNWRITDSSLNKDGKWIAGSGADWNWYTILNGHAIQDDWIQPPLSKKVPVGKRQFGTNIRIYNPKEKRWEMAWASNAGKKIDTFKAKASEGRVVMRGLYAGNETRITFFNMKPKTFDWKMEVQSKTDKTKWKEVYRIHGEKK
jgi:hypothetical protein